MAANSFWSRLWAPPPSARVVVTYYIGDVVAETESDWLTTDASLEDMIRRLGGMAAYLTDAAHDQTVKIRVEVASPDYFESRKAYYEDVLVERTRKEITRRPDYTIRDEARSFGKSKDCGSVEYQVWVLHGSDDSEDTVDHNTTGFVAPTPVYPETNWSITDMADDEVAKIVSNAIRVPVGAERRRPITESLSAFHSTRGDPMIFLDSNSAENDGP